MGNMIEWAKLELERIEKDSDGMQEQINKHILHMVEEFCKEGHSGFSASYANNILTRLLAWKPITPLTGEEDEWLPVPEWRAEGDTTQQNRRCSAVFRENFDNETASYIYGKIFSDNGGVTWFTTGGRTKKSLKSSVPITFPYHVPGEPEKVYIYPQDEGYDGEMVVMTNEDEIKELRQKVRNGIRQPL